MVQTTNSEGQKATLTDEQVAIVQLHERVNNLSQGTFVISSHPEPSLDY